MVYHAHKVGATAPILELVQGFEVRSFATLS